MGEPPPDDNNMTAGNFRLLDMSSMPESYKSYRR
jgi:hypothetical protein